MRFRKRLGRKPFKLKHQLFLIVIVVFLAPTLFFSLLLMNSYAGSQLEQSVKTSQARLEKNAAVVEQNVQTCLSVAQSFENNQNLTANIEKFLQEEAQTDAIELFNFKHTEVTANERLVNNNPILYQVRIYLDTDQVSEIIPLLYRQSRAKNLPWYEGSYQSVSGWYFDFTDNLFNASSWYNEEHLVSFISPYHSFSGKYVGILEIVSRMDLLFPLLYQNDAENWSGFLAFGGDLYQSEKGDWRPDTQALNKMFSNKTETAQCLVKKTELGTCVFCYQPLHSLSGGLVTVTRLDGTLQKTRHTQVLLLAGISLFGILFLLLINKTIDIVLKRFYRVIDAIESIRSENLYAEIEEENGGDEIGLLASSIRRMTERIRLLLLESVEKERLVRNSELRALQNQINTHFIYNVLESIKMMAEIREEFDISDAITSLGRMLRYSIKWASPQAKISEELEYIQNYIALMRLREEQDILLCLELPGSFFELQIPRLSLQPIVENAILHGMNGTGKSIRITISGELCQRAGKQAFSLTVTDSGKGVSPQRLKEVLRALREPGGKDESQGHGIGLKNIEERVKLFYGPDYGLQIESEEGAGTRVTVSFPLSGQELSSS